MKSYVGQLTELKQALISMVRLIDDIGHPGFEANLNVREMVIILYIAKTGGISMKDLSDHYNVNFSTMTGIIDRLEKKGIVVRKPNKLDKRGIIVSLEESWQQRSEIYFKHIEKLARIAFKAISKEKFDVLVKLLLESTQSAKESIDNLSLHDR